MMIDHQDFSNDFLTGKRQLGDPAADNFVREAFKDPGHKKQLHITKLILRLKCNRSAAIRGRCNFGNDNLKIQAERGRGMKRLKGGLDFKIL